MEAVILAGGFGTRLSHLIKDVPKPMAPVCGKPFLTYIVEDLKNKGITRIVMAVGYMQEKIIDYFGTNYDGIDILYSSEDTPLFTGGAIKKALNQCTDENIFILNGDTFFNVDLKNMMNEHKKFKIDLTIAVKYMENFDRYGTVNLDGTKIIGFEEKRPLEKGLINGGIYIIKRNLLNLIQKEKFSFEIDILEKKVGEIKINSFESQGYFIDIGIEEDYKKANSEISQFFKNIK